MVQRSRQRRRDGQAEGRDAAGGERVGGCQAEHRAAAGGREARSANVSVIGDRRNFLQGRNSFHLGLRLQQRRRRHTQPLSELGQYQHRGIPHTALDPTDVSTVQSGLEG